MVVTLEVAVRMCRLLKEKRQMLGSIRCGFM
jgi:uncharacterized protein YlxP (DUF503 family)